MRAVNHPNFGAAVRHLPRQHRGEGPDRRDRGRTSPRSTTSTSPRTTAARPGKGHVPLGRRSRRSRGRLRRLAEDRGVRPRAAGPGRRDPGLARPLPRRRGGLPLRLRLPARDGRGAVREGAQGLSGLPPVVRATLVGNAKVNPRLRVIFGRSGHPGYSLLADFVLQGMAYRALVALLHYLMHSLSVMRGQVGDGAEEGARLFPTDWLD